jgi:hypothetical protein
MDTLGWVIIASIIIILVLVLTFWLFNLLTFKHKVRIIDLGKQGIELDYKAKVKSIDGVNYWVLDKEPIKELKRMPIPPAKAINISKGGKKSVEAIRTETGEYIFLDRKILLNELPFNDVPEQLLDLKDENERNKLIGQWKKTKFNEWRKNNKGILLEDTYEPLTSKQRMILMHNFEKANLRKGWNWKENIVPIVSIGMLGMVVIALFIFWGDIAKPAIESKALTKDIVEIQRETVKLLQEIKIQQQFMLPRGWNNTNG